MQVASGMVGASPSAWLGSCFVRLRHASLIPLCRKHSNLFKLSMLGIRFRLSALQGSGFGLFAG